MEDYKSSTTYSPDGIAEFAKAMVGAQKLLRRAERNATNPHLKNRYADITDVFDACSEALSENGIAIIQGPGTCGNLVIETTRLIHTSGQWAENVLVLAAVDNKAQSIGSALTYARRYSLCHMVGIAPSNEDDDGNAAHGRTTKPAPAPRVATIPQPATPWTDRASLELEFSVLRAKMAQATFDGILARHNVAFTSEGPKGGKLAFLAAWQELKGQTNPNQGASA